MVIVQRDWPAFMKQVDFDLHSTKLQLLYLQDAMAQLKLSKEAFATRLGVSKKCLRKWMSAPTSTEFRQMPLMAWKFIAELNERATEVH